MGRIAAFTILIVALSACSGPRAARDGDVTPAPSEETINHAAYEDFDASAYEEDAGGEEVAHDVPASLMNNRPEAGATRTAQGFRIQITQTQDKSAADALAGEAAAWWNEQAARSDAPTYFTSAEAPVYVAYRQPYYRVRLGNFATQAEAQRAARQIAQRFAGAAVVPDTVTLPR